VVNFTNGVVNNTPFFIILIVPSLCATKIRPSGAKSIAVAFDMFAIFTWLNPAGNTGAAYRFELMNKITRRAESKFLRLMGIFFID
jgi:hypothetical protein